MYTSLLCPKELDSIETKSILVNAINSIELEEAKRRGRIFKVQVLCVTRSTLGVRKRKCQDLFDENCKEINALLKMKHYLFQTTMTPERQKKHNSQQTQKKKSIFAPFKAKKMVIHLWHILKMFWHIDVNTTLNF